MSSTPPTTDATDAPDDPSDTTDSNDATDPAASPEAAPDAAALADRLARLEARVDELEAENDQLRAENDRLRSRVQTLEEGLIDLQTDVGDLGTDVADLQGDVADLDETVDGLDETVADLEADVDRHDEQIVTGVRGRRDLHEALAELQTRELEKGAHLQDDHVDPHHITGSVDHLERIEKDEGTYVAMPGADDPLSHGGEAHLRQEDLLPIQQVARLDDDMLASETKPVQMAVAAWQERREDRYGLWSAGCGQVRQYLDASDMQDLIRRRSTSISESYCEKLAQRAFEALVDLSNNRCYVKKRSRRQDGLQYKETRLVLPADADIPGERRSFSDEENADGAGDGDDQSDGPEDSTTSPQTVDVAG